MDESLGKGIPGRGNSLGRSVEALGSCCRPLCRVVAFNPLHSAAHERPPSRSSSWEASQGRPEISASGSYCLRSLSLPKVFQECGGLTHSLP